MRVRGLALAVGLAAVSSGAALACEGRQLLFEDGFDTLEQTWGAADDSFFLDGGRLTVMPGSTSIIPPSTRWAPTTMPTSASTSRH